MKNYMRIISILFLFLSIVVLVRILAIFPLVLTTTDTPGIYLIWSVIGVVFFCMAFFFSLKYIKGKSVEKLSKIEIATGTIQFFSAILLLFSTTGLLAELTAFSFYIGILLLLLGIIAYYRSRHYICISYIAWALFIMVWVINFYNGTYVTWVSY